MGILNVTGNGLLSAGSSLVGGLFGLIGQRKANQMNMKINQMNNEFNERMLDKQLAYQTDMWNKTNEYNSASSQRERLEDAGLNPYMMMSGGNAGTATAMNGGSASAANPLAMQNVGAAAVQGSSQIGQLAANIGLATSQIAKQSAETQGLQIQNDFARERQIADLSRIYAETRNTEALADINRLRYNFDLQNFDTALKSGRIQNLLNEGMVKQVEAQTALTRLQADAQWMKNNVLPQELQMGLMQRFLDLQRTKQLTEESAAREYKLYCEAAGIQISNEVARATAKTAIDAINAQNESVASYNRTYTGSIRALDDMQEKGEQLINYPFERQYKMNALQLGYDSSMMQGFSNVIGAGTNALALYLLSGGKSPIFGKDGIKWKPIKGFGR